MILSLQKAASGGSASAASGGAGASAGPIDAGKSPEAYVRDMRAAGREMSATLLEALKVELSTCGREWLYRFFSAGGLEALAAVMITAVNANKGAHVRICLEALKSTMKLSEDLERITACPDLVAAIASALTLEWPETGASPESIKVVLDARMLSLKLLTVLVAAPDFDFHVVVEAAFERLRVTLEEEERYATLVDVLDEPPLPGAADPLPAAPTAGSAAAPGDGPKRAAASAAAAAWAAGGATNAFEQWTVKGMLLVFVNEYLNAFPSLEERARHRTELQFAGFLEALEGTTGAAVRARAAATARGEPEDSPINVALGLLESASDAFYTMMTQDDAAALQAAGREVRPTILTIAIANPPVISTPHPLSRCLLFTFVLPLPPCPYLHFLLVYRLSSFLLPIVSHRPSSACLSSHCPSSHCPLPIALTAGG